MDVRADGGVAPVARASRRLGRGPPLPRLHAEVARARACCIRSSAITSRRSAPRRCASTSGTRCRGSSRKSSGDFCAAGSSRAASRGSTVADAARTVWSRSRVRVGPSTPVAAGAAWPSGRRIWLFPVVPVRQWVLSLPHRLRYVLAWDHALCRAVSGVFVRAVLGHLRRHARQTGATGGRGGAVAIIQRFGAALNFNVHVHALVLDGVYVEDGGILQFHEAMPPTDDEMDRLLGTIDRRIPRLLARRGVLDDLGDGSAADPLRDEAPVLAGIAAASVQGRRALGARVGAAVRRCGASADLSRWRRLGADPVTPAGTASICMPLSSCRRGIGRGSNGCAATRGARRLRLIDCT